MAKRENQAIQAALIIFVIITIGLSVTTYYFYREFEEASKKQQTFSGQVTQLEKKQLDLIDQLTVYRYTVGMEGVTAAAFEQASGNVTAGEGPDGEFSSLISQFKKDMATYGVGLAQSQLSYQTLPKNLSTRIQDLHRDLKIAQDETKRIELELAAERTKHQDAIAKIVTEFDTAKADYQVARAVINKRIDSI